MAIYIKPKPFKKHGQITDLSKPFKLPDYAAVALMIVPKTTTGNQLTTIDCKCICDTVASPLPILLYNWTDAQFKELEAGSVDLTEYDLFWGEPL